jgi:hypothetical protein
VQKTPTNYASGDHQLSFKILRTLVVKEVLPLIELRVDPQVSFTQSHEGRNMQDSRGSQVVKLEAVIPQKRVEEPMWWHAESLLIERRKGHHVSFHRCRECKVRRNPTSLELRRSHKPMLHEYLQVAQRNGGKGPILLCHGRRRKGGQHLRDPGITSYFFFRSLLFLSLFLFSRHREGGQERTTDGVQGYRAAQGRSLASNPTASVVKQLGPLRYSKGPGKLSLPASHTPHISC